MAPTGHNQDQGLIVPGAAHTYNKKEFLPHIMYLLNRQARERMGGETKPRRDEETCPRSQDSSVTEMGLEHRSANSQPRALAREKQGVI